MRVVNFPFHSGANNLQGTIRLVAQSPLQAALRSMIPEWNPLGKRHVQSDPIRTTFIASAGPKKYPGNIPSLSRPVFALDKEPGRASHSPSWVAKDYSLSSFIAPLRALSSREVTK